jgi:hypothetical protein
MPTFVRTIPARATMDTEVKALMVFSGIGLLLSLFAMIVGVDPIFQPIF